MAQVELIHNGTLIETYDTLSEALEDFNAMVEDMPHNYIVEQDCRPSFCSMEDYEETLEIYDKVTEETLEYEAYTVKEWERDSARWEHEKEVEELQREFDRLLDLDTLKGLRADLNNTSVAWRVYFDTEAYKIYAREFASLDDWVDFYDEDIIIELYKQDAAVLDEEEVMFGSIAALQNTLEKAFEVVNV